MQSVDKLQKQILTSLSSKIIERTKVISYLKMGYCGEEVFLAYYTKNNSEFILGKHIFNLEELTLDKTNKEIIENISNELLSVIDDYIDQKA